MSSAKTGVLQLAPQTGEQAQCYIDLARLLVTGTRSFYNNPTFSDITLVCPDGRQLRCHQVILAASSKRLASVLKQGGFTGAKLPVQGVDSDALDTLIDSFYTGECPLTLATAASIYDAAVKLEVNGLPNAVEQFVSASLTPNNACLLLDRALSTKTGRLAEVCLQFIRARLSEVVPTLEFSASNMDVVVQICTDVAANRHAPQLALQVAIAWLRGPPSGPTRTHLLPVLADQIGISPDLLQTYMRTSGNTPGVGSTVATPGAGGGGGGGGNVSGITTVSLLGEPPSMDDTLTLNSLPLLQLLPPGQLQQLGMGGSAASAAAAQLLLAQSKGGGTAALRSLLEEENAAAAAAAGGTGIGVDGASLAQRLGNLAGLRRELEEGALAAAAAAAAAGGTSGRGKRPRTDEGQRSSGWEQGMQRTEQEQQPPSMGRGLSGDQDMVSLPAAAGGGGGGGGPGFAGSAGVGQMALPAPPPTYPDPPPRDRRTPQVKGVCHVEGCYADLTGLRDYHLRYKICEFHLKVSSVLKDGVPQRFCQQCGRFHHLSEFDGSRRSCRTMLARHNMRRAKKLGQGGSPMADDGGAGNAGNNAAGASAAAGATGTGAQSSGNDISTKLIQQLGMAAMATLGGSSGGQQQPQAGAQQQQQLAQLGIQDGLSLTDAVAAAMAGLQGNSSAGPGVGGGSAAGLLSSPVGRRLNELLDGLGRAANGSVGGVQVGNLLEALTGVAGGGGTGNSGGEGGHGDGDSGAGIGEAMGGGIAGVHVSEDDDSKRAAGGPVAALEAIAAAATGAGGVESPRGDGANSPAGEGIDRNGSRPYGSGGAAAIGGSDGETGNNADGVETADIKQ
ncbi:hypothetical protein Vretimale_4149 [Volvox reticuliferus]|uniref:BTB domain-containing protein n=1 Tax=Volvox reticuliferus TaxID=1737510 RepID=A0A8J4C0K5_9CHLO|nr:hypothetical protein Vretifemale_2729 [Volvox reticuliferus]GIL98844.1 hypothetical protein Vretimale_4149 [Volvox reticuliferus]